MLREWFGDNSKGNKELEKDHTDLKKIKQLYQLCIIMAHPLILHGMVLILLFIWRMKLKIHGSHHIISKPTHSVPGIDWEIELPKSVLSSSSS
jgi:hypothetical protein